MSLSDSKPYKDFTSDSGREIVCKEGRKQFSHPLFLCTVLLPLSPAGDSLLLSCLQSGWPVTGLAQHRAQWKSRWATAECMP